MQNEFKPLVSAEAEELDMEVRNVLSRFDLKSMSGRLRFLHNLLSSPLPSFRQQCQCYLRGGREIFGQDYGLLIRIENNQRVVVACDGTADKVQQGQRLPILGSFCKDQLAQGRPVVSQPMVDTVQINPLAYNGLEVKQFLGAPLRVAGELVGTLGFFSPRPRDTAFTEQDVETLELMAEGVARMIELQTVETKDRPLQAPDFATAGVKSFEEYENQARIPEVYGVPGRVVEVLQRRIGKTSLAIDHIAEELNLSKRTLQRRLQQQNISFAQLRDQVRFHYAIDYLVEQHMSIDSISASLDFSDRTSFTNAFKRWTGLSPSTFRKLFRDYT